MDTLNKMTKAELVRLLVQRNAELVAMRLELSIARADAARGAAPTRPATPGAIAYRQQCAAAREAAMRLGKSVLVDRAINSGAST